MKTLAIDTSNQGMGVAVGDGALILGEIITNMKKNHSVRLMPAVESLLNEVQWETADLDCVAVAQGPGSYTGVRIGVTVAKTLAWTLGLPIVAVSSLEVLAQNGGRFEGSIAPLFDARRGRVYTGLYEKKTAMIENVKKERITPLTDWLQELKRRSGKILFIGQDLDIHQNTIVQFMGDQAVFAEAGEQNPRPAKLVLLANRRESEPSVHGLVPEYLQLAEAESKWFASQE